MEIVSNVATTEAKSSAPSESSKASPLLWNLKKIKQYADVFRVLSLVLVAFNVFSFLGSQALLDSHNRYLSLIGIEENLGQSYAEQQTRSQTLEVAIAELSGHTAYLKERIAQGDFSNHAQTIADIRSQQQTWFNRGQKLGLLDTVSFLEAYFNEGHFQHPILFRSGNNLSISNLNFQDRHLTLTIKCSNFFGNIFMLSSEIKDIINGLPHFKDGEILSYQRQKQKDGNDTMTFSLNLALQSSEDTDPEDGNPSSTSFYQWALSNLSR